MKKSMFFSAAILLFGMKVYAQSNLVPVFNLEPKAASGEFSFEVHGNYEHPIYKDQVEKAKTLSDLIEYFPSSWIKEYVSVELLTINNGLPMKALSNNEQLSAEQKSMLKTADLSKDIAIRVKYISKSTAKKDDINKDAKGIQQEMKVNLTLIPETQAVYIAGDDQMNSYFKTKIVNQVPKEVFDKVAMSEVRFTVNELGEIENTKIHKSCGDEKTDALVMNAINTMSKWKPAENAKGVKVKQEFRFNFGRMGC